MTTAQPQAAVPLDEGFKLTTGPVSLADALMYADMLEREVGMIANRQAKPGSLTIEAIARLVQFARNIAKGTVPPGFAVVPVEPTTAMLAAGERALDKWNWESLDASVWRAMLRASDTSGGSNG